MRGRTTPKSRRSEASSALIFSVTASAVTVCATRAMGVWVVSSHAQHGRLGAHHHQRLLARFSERRFEILRVAGEMECVALHLMLVDRSGDEYVDLSRLEVGHSAFERRHGGLAGRACGLSRLHLGVLAYDVDDIVVSVASFRCLLHLVERQRREFECLAVECGDLGRSIDHRSAQLEDRFIFQSFHYHFIAYAVDVAVGYSYLEFVVVSHLSL